MDGLSFVDKASRVLKTMSAAGGIATRYAFDSKTSPDEHAAILYKTLGDLKGPLVKLAQFLATVPGALPNEYAESFLALQSNAPAMGVPFVRRRLTTELGPDALSKFQNFEFLAANAASLGQVHKAILTSGEEVAVKLQYPGMDDILKTDLGQLSLLLKLYQGFNSAIKTTEIEAELTERLLEELDYLNEAKNLKKFQSFFLNSDRVIVPTVYDAYTTKRLLTLSWHSGRKVFDFVSAEPEIRNQLGKDLFETWYRPFYQMNMVHADPHPGNYLISDDLKIILLDFGCVRYFHDDFINGVLLLYIGLLKGNKKHITDAYDLWGFKNLDADTADIITEWAKMLYEPLLDDRVRLIQKDTNGEHGYKTALKIHEALNKTNGIAPPKAFVFMDRASVGIGSILMRLKSEQNWHQLFLSVAESRLNALNF
jgi:predicted unusual protein kinase regulating ubiquinone biosynthesis (AarF/ABC1/UbiB family)